MFKENTDSHDETFLISFQFCFLLLNPAVAFEPKTKNLRLPPCSSDTVRGPGCRRVLVCSPLTCTLHNTSGGSGAVSSEEKNPTGPKRIQWQ